MIESIIKTENLSKEFGGRDILKNVNLEVGEGEIFALIGPAHAGKTTLLLTLNGFYRPSVGRIYINGTDLTEKKTALRLNIGYLPQRAGFYELMTAAENLAFFAGLYGFSRSEVKRIVRESLAYVSLEEYADTPVKTFTAGMLQRLGLAKALIHQPKIILLDEPHTGLDPEEIEILHRLVRKLGKEKRTVLLTAGSLSTVVGLCTHIGVVLAGEMVYQGPLEQFTSMLRNSYSKYELTISANDPAAEESPAVKSFEIPYHTPVTEAKPESETLDNTYTEHSPAEDAELELSEQLEAGCAPESAIDAPETVSNTYLLEVQHDPGAKLEEKPLEALGTEGLAIIDYDLDRVLLIAPFSEEMLVGFLKARGIQVQEVTQLPIMEEELYLHYCRQQKRFAQKGGAECAENNTAPLRD